MALSWADKRRFYIIGGAVLIGLTLLLGVVFAVIYKVPSCADGKQNQDESGVDCGGSCQYLCNAEVEEPRVTFARAITTNGRTDVIAYVENRNRSAEAKSASYAVEVFSEDGTLLGTRKGMLDLPARTTIPVFVPGVAAGTAFAPRAFISFEEDMKWRNVRDEVATLAVGNASLVPGDRPRVVATISNPSPTAVYDQEVVATVYGLDGLAIAASRTVVRVIDPLASKEAVFTWLDPFPTEATRVEVRVVPELP